MTDSNQVKYLNLLFCYRFMKHLFYVFHVLPPLYWAFLVAQMVKDLPKMQKTQVPSLGREDPLEKGMATHTSILAWRIPWTEA